MSDASAHQQRTDHVIGEAKRLQSLTAEVAGRVAITEEQVAGTLERIAECRPASDAKRLQAEAERARRYAAKERGRSNG